MSDDTTELRAQHRPRYSSCIVCRNPYPCLPIRALDAAEQRARDWHRAALSAGDRADAAEKAAELAEADAVAAERARITAAVEASYGVAIDAGPRWVPLAAVLAIVNPEPKEDR